MKWLIVLMLFCISCKTSQNSNQISNTSSSQPDDSTTERLSPFYSIDENEIDLFASFAGWNETQSKHQVTSEIEDKMLKMIEQAQHTILLSTFLFDTMHADTPPTRKVTEEIKNALIKKKQELGDSIRIAVVLDPLNRSYYDDHSQAAEDFRNAGIDLFYTDLLQTKPAIVGGAVEAYHHTQRAVAVQTGSPLTTGDYSSGIIAILNKIAVHLPFASSLNNLTIKNDAVYLGGEKQMLNGKAMIPQQLVYAAIAKANHRKMLVTDSGNSYQAMIASQNPHSASFPSANYALVVKNKTAKYIYNTILLDINYSISVSESLKESGEKFYERFTRWSTKRKQTNNPVLNFQNEFDFINEQELMPSTVEKSTKVAFASEEKIRDQILNMLEQTKPDSMVRLQMFYLSDIGVVDAILKVAAQANRTAPIQVLLDPNKDAFNKIKDGSPNRQVAQYMMAWAKKNNIPESIFNVRWYATHGEQNHAKIISITGPNQLELTTGSANWTGRNLKGVNFETNLFVKGSKKINQKYNDLFDRFWSCGPNKCDLLFSYRYTPELSPAEHNFHIPADTPPSDPKPYGKWASGEQSGFCSW